jgi:glycosyltransferase involved in cell wall biosynthesis
MRKVFFFTKYSIDGPSSRYRTYYFQEYFIKNGIIAEIVPLFYNNYINDYNNNRVNYFKILTSYLNRIIFIYKNLFDNSFVVIEKELFPYIPFFIEKLFLNKFLKKFSIDYDDAVFYNYRNNLFLKNKHLSLAKYSRFITVGNNWYSEIFLNSSLFYLPTVIKSNNTVRSNINNHIPIIVWIGTKSNIKYLNEILPILLNIKNKGILFSLRLIGVKLFHNKLIIENIDWDENTEYEYLRTSDIGIMPLSNTNWEKGKCGFKLLQYMNVHLPVVASPVSANNEIIKHGYNGFLANDDNEWEYYLTSLLINKTLRKDFGINGNKIFKEYYSLDIWGNKYANFLNSNLD